MNSDNDRKQASERDDQTSGIAPSAAKLKRIIGPSPGCRMLTPYEIELLRKSKREMAQVAGEVFAEKKDAPDS